MKKAGRLPLVGAGRSARVDLTGLRPLSDEDAERVARRLASEPEGSLGALAPEKWAPMSRPLFASH
jgi:hypothetical protein